MITYQSAIVEDLSAIATLHAKSWQNSYQGILSPHYLKYEVEKERLAVWTKRFQEIPKNQHIITAKDNGQLCGFVCLYANDHPTYGTLLDNLHVDKSYQGKGIGKKLLELGKDWVQQQTPKQGMYLWVFASNHTARAFYERVGGQLIETIPYSLMDGSGGFADTARYYWG